MIDLKSKLNFLGIILVSIKDKKENQKKKKMTFNTFVTVFLSKNRGTSKKNKRSTKQLGRINNYINEKSWITAIGKIIKLHPTRGTL